MSNNWTFGVGVGRDRGGACWSELVRTQRREATVDNGLGDAVAKSLSSRYQVTFLPIT